MARILIADDSHVARKILRNMVVAQGHVVIGEVANGTQAFVEYTKLKPDVVTMDLTMQGMGGAEATSKIMAAYPNARIIVISAMEVRKGVIDALERGARHFLIKPIQPEQVAKVLNYVLQQKFDLQKHRERVRKLKVVEDSLSLVDNQENKITPPYDIRVQDHNLVHVMMNSSITLTSYHTLLLEMEEHLNSKSRILLDFGSTLKLEQEILVKINEFIQNIENRSGMVKAISSNKNFVNMIVDIKTENKANLLADILRYFEN